ncbi:MAG: ABC transporter ATP-binding protein [bacterium]|nr:ABC transporter ATP-binding protein [bacterium]
MTTPLLQARRVTRAFRASDGALEVLHAVDLEVRRGEFVAITGPSGSGKSTLLYLLGAMDRPDEGEILIGGQSTSSLGESDLASLRQRHIGFVFQFHFLLQDLTAVENVMTPLLLGGMSFRKASEQATGMLEQVGLGHRLTHLPSRLSGGEQQRVAIARALVHRPALLLGDEPTGNLDTRTGEQIHALLRQANREHGQTIVLVTHNPALAALADRVISIEDGRVHGV